MKKKILIVVLIIIFIRALLKRMVAMVCRYVSEHSTVEQLVRAYAAGEYRSSIIFKDLRRTLEGYSGCV